VPDFRHHIVVSAPVNDDLRHIVIPQRFDLRSGSPAVVVCDDFALLALPTKPFAGKFAATADSDMLDLIASS
jgi:hypothetical protein